MDFKSAGASHPNLALPQWHSAQAVGGLHGAGGGLERDQTVFVKQSDNESHLDWLEFRIGEELQRGDRVSYFRAKQREFNAEYHIAKYFKLGGSHHYSHDMEIIANESWLLSLPNRHVNVLKPVAATFHQQGFVTFHDKFNCSVDTLFGNTVSAFRLKLLSEAAQQERLFIFDKIALDICSALKWFHDNNAVHLNVNPDTVVLRIVTEADCEPFALMYPDTSECFCLTGFEMMKRLPVSRAPVLTGKKGFVPKEILSKKAGKIGAAADIWQMGATLWWVISGLTADEFDHDICAHLIGEDRAYILDTCLEADPEDRTDLKTVVDRITKMHEASPRLSGLAQVIRKVQRSAAASAKPQTFAELWKEITVAVKGNEDEGEDVEGVEEEENEESDMPVPVESEAEPEPEEEPAQPSQEEVVATETAPQQFEAVPVPEPEGELTTQPCDYTGADEMYQFDREAALAAELAAVTSQMAAAQAHDPSENSLAE